MAIDEQESQASAAEAPEHSEGSNVASSKDPQPTELEKALAERDQAIAEKAELLDRLRRAQAEFENARKRLQREQEETREYAAMSIIEALLPVVDDFDRAVAETDEEDQQILEVYRKGYRFKERLLRPAMVKVAVKE